MDEKTISLADLSSYRLVSKKDWEKIKKLVRELSEERSVLRAKYQKLKILHSVLDSAYDAVVCQRHGYEKVVAAHGINQDEVRAAINKYSRAEIRAKAADEILYPDPEEVRAFYEKTTDPDDDDYDGWGNTFEQAVQKKSKNKAEEEQSNG